MVFGFFWPNLDEIDIDDMYFQQDGATCHISSQPIALLHEKLPDRVIFRNGDVNWPSNACDLTPFVFFFSEGFFEIAHLSE